ncbi:MAG: hypothetical protein ACUVWJ_08835 [Spirochaetota bacterium]
MLLDPLMLNLYMPAGDALTFFTEPPDVRAAILDKEGLSILAKGIIKGSRSALSIEFIYNVVFCCPEVGFAC